MRKKVVDGTATFTGQLAHPCYAEVATVKGHHLVFFVESSDITIRFNEDNPESSPVNGSRINSQYRYALEQSRGSKGEYNIAALTEEVTKNKSTIFAPYIIYRHLMPLINKAKLAELMALLEGEATKSYHYKMLTRHIESTADIAEGKKMPDIIFTDAKKNEHHTDSLLSDTALNLIIVGASWCKQCKRAENEARQHYKKYLADMGGAQHPHELNIIVINIDDDNRVWDADIIKRMQIEHIPYLILISPDRKIAAKDIRAWEVGRMLRIDN